MSAPLVSVLIPSYNYARYVGEAIESVLVQDLKDLELVIVDDGSSDDSVDVIRGYADRDARIRFDVHPENVGMVPNWNACLERARGKFVRYLLADDTLYKPTALREMVELFEANPEARLVSSARAILDERSDVRRIKGFSARSLVIAGPDAIADCIGTGSNLIGEPSAVMFRRTDARRGFHLNYNQLVDLEMWFHLLRDGDFAYTPSCLCGFRRHDKQQSSVNRGTSLAAEEFSRLALDYAETAEQVTDSRRLAGWVYRLKRLHSRPEGAKAAAERIEHKLGSGARLHELRYRLTRPLVNLERQMRRNV